MKRHGAADAEGEATIDVTSWRSVRSRREASAALRDLADARNAALAMLPPQPDLAAAFDQFALLWAQENRGFVPRRIFDDLVRRVGAEDGRSRAHVLFGLSRWSAWAGLIRVLRRHPCGVINPFSRDRRLRPLIEVEMHQRLPVGITSCGIRPGDRLIVHVGSEVYDGALVLLSLKTPGERSAPDRRVDFISRVVSVHDDPSGNANISLRLRDGDPPLELPTDGLCAEGVIFNRDDLLIDFQRD